MGCCGTKDEEKKDGADPRSVEMARGDASRQGGASASAAADGSPSAAGGFDALTGPSKALPAGTGTTQSYAEDSRGYQSVRPSQVTFDDPTAFERNFRYETEEYVFKKPKGTKGSRVITILLLGETGSGKSTLVNAMVNHAAGVEYDDPVRYRAVPEIERHEDEQHLSQTRDVGVYRVWCDAIQCTLRIVDTPGFGDTGGLQQDEVNANSIKSAIERESEIHGVCFVAAATRPRLTMTQKYIISRVLGCFGKDAAAGIFVLATFADGKRAPVLDAFRADNSFPYSDERSFHFNNSALYATGNERTAFTKGFWALGKESCIKFFQSLAGVTPFQLQDTVDVIATQRRLEGYVKGLTPQVTVGIHKATNLRNLLSDIDMRRREIDETGQYTYTAAMPRVEKEMKKPGTFTTQCLKCSYSCHEECTRPDDEKHLCCVMDAAGNCVVCPNKCSFADHRNLDYIYVWYTDMVQREYDQMKLQNLALRTGLSKSQAITAEVTKEMHGVCTSVGKLLGGINQAHQKLNTLALRPSGLSLDDYLSVMVTEELTANKPGYEDRVAVLNALRGVARPPPHLTEMVNMMNA
eukprot:Rhum_TRINITY_DN4583_c0_g1::Rhum_TRINITY_DN4583_c0_g1_i1::g.14932::m.14932